MNIPSPALAAGDTVGPYRIVGRLGAGGMGEVYVARDERLARDVALKVLPASLAHDPERLERLHREARAAGGLNHPNVVVIHDIGTHEAGPLAGSTYLVMERLVGGDLRVLLSDGRPLPLRQTLDIARQAAAGLAAAHGQGIVHRDLKPENIFVTADGVVKILDFGLARVQARMAEGERSDSLAATELTSNGMLLGTAGYMSPEQISGGAVDHRSDIFAFGAILFEMLTGRRAFAGTSALRTLNAIVEGEVPAPSTVDPRVPAPLDAIVRHCLEKEPRRRYQSAADLEFHLASAGESGRIPSESTARPASTPAPATPAPATPVARRFAPLGAALLLGLAVGYGLAGLPERGGAPTGGRGAGPSLIYLPGSGIDYTPALSPDGRFLAFGTSRDSVSGIWLRTLADGSETPLTRGDDHSPSFSPDGAQLLFTRNAQGGNSIWKVAAVGGDARKLVTNADFGVYSPDGTQLACILPPDTAGIDVSRVGIASADGTGLRRIAEFRERDITAMTWSPDGREVAVVTSSNQSVALPEVVTRISLGDGRQTPVRFPEGGVTDFRGLLWPSRDHLLVANNDDLNGASSRLLSISLVSGIVDTLFRLPCKVDALSRSLGGDFVIGSRLLFSNLRSFEIPGREPSAPSTALTRGLVTDRQPYVSPDGRWVYYTSTRSGNQDIWRMSLVDGRIERITDHPSDDWDPVLSRDGKWLVWSSRRAGQFDIWLADAEGGGARQVTRDLAPSENPTMTPDGEWIVFASAAPDARGLWKVHPDGTGARRIVAGDLRTPDVSQDGRWVAARAPGSINVYSVEDGTPSGIPIDINVKAYSLGGLGRIRWHPNGRDILFTAQDESGLEGGVYRQAFEPGRSSGGTRQPLAMTSTEYPYATFAITPDGRRLILSRLQLQESLMLLGGVALRR